MPETNETNENDKQNPTVEEKNKRIKQLRIRLEGKKRRKNFKREFDNTFLYIPL